MSLWRSRWAAFGAAVAVTLGAGGLGIVQATTSSGEKPIYKPINPCRLADTRPAPDTVGDRTTPVGAEESYTLTGWGDVGNCELPNGSAGLALNVTAVAPSQATYLTLYPTGALLPTTSNLNPTPGQPPTPNAVNVDLNGSGEFDVFNKYGSVHVIVDVVGYYDDHNHDDRYYKKDEINALVDPISSSPTVLGYGHDWVSNGGNPSTVGVFENGASINGGTGGTAHLALTGPITMSGISYKLASVTYCVESYGGFVDEASIIGLGNLIPGDDLETSVEVKDRTDRTGPGCYTITSSAEVAARRGHHLMLFVVGEVSISEVTATWIPGA